MVMFSVNILKVRKLKQDKISMQLFLKILQSVPQKYYWRHYEIKVINSKLQYFSMIQVAAGLNKVIGTRHRQAVNQYYELFLIISHPYFLIMIINDNL